MSRLYTVLFSVAGLAVLFASPLAQAADEPKDILEKAIKAHGGEKVLTKYQAAELKTKGKIDLPGVGEVEFTQETSYMLPNKYRDSMELKIQGQNIPVLTLVNGDKISIEANGQAVAIDDKIKEAVKIIPQILKIQRLVPLRDKKYELSIIGEDKVEGKKVVGIRVSGKKQKEVSLYFYKDSGLIAKIQFRNIDASSGNEVDEERIVTEYRKQDGIPVPKTVLVKRDGKKLLETEVTEIKMLEKLDDSVFTK